MRILLRNACTKHLALVLCLLVVLAAPGMAAAHGSGASWERTEGVYRIDVGYDPEAFLAGASSVFDFALVDAASGEQVPVDEIWVRLAQGNKTLLAGGLRQGTLARTTLLYAFFAPGDYSLSVSFRRGAETIAQGDFPFRVEAQEKSAGLLRFVPYGLGTLVLIGALLGVRHMRKRRATPQMR